MKDQILRKESAMRYLLYALVIAVLSPAVFAQDVRYNFDENANFSQYKTYRWVQHPQSTPVDDLTIRQLKEAFTAELAKKGLSEKSEGADLLIVYEIATRQEQQLKTWDTGWGYGPGWRGGWYGPGGGMSTTTSQTLTIGSLALDMYDTQTKNLVWRGVVSKTIDEKAKPDKQRKNMQKAAEKLLKNYPPKKK
jgi:hypothetical protein